MIAGVATVTIVVSTRIMKKPRHSAKSAGQGLHLDGWSGLVGCQWTPSGVPTDDDSTAAMDNQSHEPQRPDGGPPAHAPARRPGHRRARGWDAPVDVVRRHPASPSAWAALAGQARGEGADDVTVYAYSRVGYHRSLDLLRRNGWKGHGPVPWEHEPNRGFLRCLALLALSAQAIGETEEWDRCSAFLRDSSPAAYDALLG